MLRRSVVAVLMALGLLALSSLDHTRARVGINIPVMGIVFWQAGHDWDWSVSQYFSAGNMREIKNNLHADFVRTGFIPDWIHAERTRWSREDEVMDAACSAGLGVVVIVPIGLDQRGDADLLSTVRAFFTRYLAREPNCALVAELGNEIDLESSPQQYAHRWALLAPVVRAAGVPVVTSGTSGVDTKWTQALAKVIAPPPDAYSLHPYGVSPSQMRAAVAATAAAAQQPPEGIYITEFGSHDAGALSQSIAALAEQPLISIYEYRCQPTDDNCGYGLKDNPALYAAVANAFASIAAQR